MIPTLRVASGQPVLVDPDVWEWASAVRWHLAGGSNPRHRYACRTPVEGVERYLHRAIMAPPPGLVVDHINHQPLDCRRENMRVVTIAQNTQNVLPRVGCSSAYRGVSWDSSRQKWHAYINLDGRRRYLGRYTDEVDAAAAARQARAELHPFSSPEEVPA